MRCPGTYHNGPEKRFVRCDTCKRIDYECNEGDSCREEETEDFTRGVLHARKMYAQAYCDATQQSIHSAEFTTVFLTDELRRLTHPSWGASDEFVAGMRERIDQLVKELKVAEAFHKEAVAERDYERHEVLRLGDKLAEAFERIKDLDRQLSVNTTPGFETRLEEVCEWCDSPVNDGKTHGENQCFCGVCGDTHDLPHGDECKEECLG